MISIFSLSQRQQQQRRDVERRTAVTPQPMRKSDATKQFLSPNLGGRVRKMSKSSDDLIGKSERWAGEMRGGLSASLQKDIHLVSSLKWTLFGIDNMNNSLCK